MSALESWAYLNRVIEGPSTTLWALRNEGYTADEIAEGVRTRAPWLGDLAADTDARYTWDQPAEDLATAAEHGYSLITPESPEWPRERIYESFRLGAKLSVDGEGVPARPDGVPPHALWVRGNTNLPELLENSIAIVGTRALSAYGHSATRDIVHGLKRWGYTIVSGGALGIDAAAHDAALEAGLPTVVFAACGPGVTYPRRHQQLFDRIVAAGGAIITEYSPGMAPERHRFLTRNRLVAGLTQATLVIEAAYRSGALSTLRWAQYYHRGTLAVPGPITTAGSVGTNLAIYKGEATMVLNATYVHEAIRLENGLEAEQELADDNKATPLQLLTRTEMRIYDASPKHHREGLAAEEIARAAALSLQVTVNVLIELQGKGLIQRDGQLWRRSETAKT